MRKQLNTLTEIFVHNARHKQLPLLPNCLLLKADDLDCYTLYAVPKSEDVIHIIRPSAIPTGYTLMVSYYARNHEPPSTTVELFAVVPQLYSYERAHLSDLDEYPGFTSIYDTESEHLTIYESAASCRDYGFILVPNFLDVDLERWCQLNRTLENAYVYHAWLEYDRVVGVDEWDYEGEQVIAKYKVEIK